MTIPLHHISMCDLPSNSGKIASRVLLHTPYNIVNSKKNIERHPEYEGGQYRHEGDVLRYEFFHSIVLDILVGGRATLQAYVAPFSHLVV